MAFVALVAVLNVSVIEYARFVVKTVLYVVDVKYIFKKFENLAFREAF